MEARARFPERVFALIRDGKTLRIRAGAEHRFIGIWVVVVERRVFVRSWSVKPDGWYRAFREDPRGAVLVDGRELPVRAVRARGERLKDAISRAYLEKYGSSIKYARDMGRPRSRSTTTELLPSRGARP